jgi:hypothetical protein
LPHAFRASFLYHEAPHARLRSGGLLLAAGSLWLEAGGWRLEADELATYQGNLTNYQ